MCCVRAAALQEMLARALYALEMAWHPQFDVRTANCRLEFQVEENQALFVALFRHVQVQCAFCWDPNLPLCTSQALLYPAP